MTQQDLTQYLDEVRQVNSVFAQLAESGGLPKLEEPGGLEAMRAMAKGGGMFGGPAATPIEPVVRTIDGPGGPIPLRIFVPDGEVTAVYLDIHGGGWSMMSAELGDADNAQLAIDAGVIIVSVEYRLAPENPYPAGPDDCEAAAVWVLEHSRSEWGVDQILIGGGSAGAHLAVVTALRLRERGLIDRVAGLNLLVGVYDLTGTPSCRNADSPLSGSFKSNMAVVEFFLPGTTTEERKDPAYSPLYADLTGLPPALFSAAGLDALRDDSIFMSALWQAAGNDAALIVYPECTHIFTGLPTKIAAAAKERMTVFVRDRARAGFARADASTH